MQEYFSRIADARNRVWQWFVAHAHGRHALAWLALIAFTDTIFSPLAPEVFLVALCLAHPKRWKEFFIVAITFSTAGAVVGFYIASFVFHQFGEPMLHLLGLEKGFEMARHLLHGRVFTAMALASFTPLPDKVFIYAAGFLGVHFVPYITGFFAGRAVRMALICYCTGRFGKQVLDMFERYFMWFWVILLTLLAVYGIVRLHLFGL